jgi:two-component system, NarL family, response regulator LiaR
MQLTVEHAVSKTRPIPPKRRPRSARQVSPAPAPRVRIVVADSLAIDRGGLVGLIDDERDLEVVGESATLEETIQQCKALAPDVLVLALNLAGQESQPALTALHAALPGLKVLALAERGALDCLVLNPPARRARAGEELPACGVGTDCLTLAVAQGAMATLRRTADPEELFRAIRAVAEGGASYDAGTAASLRSANLGARDRATDHRQLTGRELEVAALIADGRSNKEISTALEISEATVKKHVGSVLVKLGLEDRLQAGLYLARNPLVFSQR